MLRIAALLAAALGLVACGESTEQRKAEQTNDPAVRQGETSPGYSIRRVEATLTEGTNMALAVVPGSEQRVVSLQGQLFLLPEASGDSSAVPLTDPYFDAREPTVDERGRIVFHGYKDGDWDIWLTDLSGKAPESLTDDPFDDREPVLIGDALYFSSDRGGSYDIWRLDLTTEALTQVTRTDGDAYAPSVFGEDRVAYAETHRNRSGLMLIEGGETRLLAGHGGSIAGVQFSADGNRISYQVRSGVDTEKRLFDLQSNTSRQISEPGSDVFPFRAAWLDDDELAYAADGKIVRYRIPDGEVADWPFSITLGLERHDYERRRRNYDPDLVRNALGIANLSVDDSGANVFFTALGDIWRWRSEAGELVQLTDSPAAEFGVALHPSGTAMAYVSDEGGRIGLYQHDLVSGLIERVEVPATQISHPSYAPSGEELAFFIDVPGNPLGGQLVVMSLASGEIERVGTPMPAQPISWSRGGDRVAATRLNPYSGRYREGVYELVITDWRSGEVQIIAPSPHQSISDAVLTGDGAMTFVRGGHLHRLELDETLNVIEGGGQLTDELTDGPSFSANGRHAVYLSGNRVMQLSEGVSRDVTPKLPWQMAAPKDRYVVRVGRLFSPETRSYLLDRDVTIDGANIVSVEPASAGVTPDVDASNLTAVPGLFEMHAHMGETSEVQGRIWLAHGITTVRDPGSNPYVAKQRQEAWDSGRRIGPRTHVTGFLTDGNRVFYSMAEGIVSEAHLELALERTKRLELDFIKTYVRLPDDWQRRVVHFAHTLGIPVSSHELYPAVAHGMDHVEHIGGTSRRGYQPKVSRGGYSYQDVVELLSVSGMGITATAVLPGFSVIVADEPDWLNTRQFDAFYGARARRAYEQLLPRFGATAKPFAEANGGLLRALTQRDALLVTGTDAPFVPYGAGLHAEFRLYARAGVSPADILRQATEKSARAAGVWEELGSIEPGKLADLVLVDGDPVNDIRDLTRVVMTIKHGFRYPLESLLP